MLPTLEGILIVVFLAFGVFWIGDGWSWAGEAMVFGAGTLFGSGLVRYRPWDFSRWRRQ